jgi:hypothetical protein
MAMPGRDTARGSQSADRGAPARQRAAVLATPETNSDDRPVGAASQMREITDVLSKLADLRDNGALTDQEFNAQSSGCWADADRRGQVNRSAVFGQSCG